MAWKHAGCSENRFPSVCPAGAARVPRVPGAFPGGRGEPRRALQGCTKPKAQSPRPAQAAPPRQPRLMIHSCGSGAVNHRSPSPSCGSPAVHTPGVIYLRRAMQSGSPGAVSECCAPRKWLQLKFHNISLPGTWERRWWQPRTRKGLLWTPFPTQRHSRLICRILHGQQQDCAGHWCPRVLSVCTSCNSKLPRQKWSGSF